MDGNGVFYDQYGAPIGKLAGDGTIYGHTEAPPVGGSGSDSTYLHVQNVPLAQWVVLHNLGKYPSVTVLDSAGNDVVGDIFHNSVTSCTLTFGSAFAGRASCN